MIELHINNARMSLKCLTLQRELKEVRTQRAATNGEHFKFVRHYNTRIADASKRLGVAVHGTNLKPHIDAAEKQYIDFPPKYIIRKYAELVKVARAQEVLETYTRLLQQQNREMIEELHVFRHEMLSELKEKRDQREEQAYLIQEQRVHLLTEKVRSYYAEKNKTVVNQTSILQQIVLRKANQRLCLVN